MDNPVANLQAQEKETIWLVFKCWTDPEQDETRLPRHNIEVFKNREDAIAFFKETVQEEKADAWGGVINEDGSVADGYLIEDDENSFFIAEKAPIVTNYECIILRALEVR